MEKYFTLKELATLTGSLLSGNPDTVISSYDELKTAGPTDASFLANMRYKETMAESKAGVICVNKGTELFEGKNFLISDHPSATFQKIIDLFFDKEAVASGFQGIHPSAVIHPSVKIGKDVSIGPLSVIDKGCEIGDNTVILSHVSIGSHVKIGQNCLFHPHTTVREACAIGHRVILQPGAVIGSCGYGYQTTAQGTHEKLDQIGNVILEDDVEIGANTAIDRARFKSTLIKRGTKIDNLVQIGHNVSIGEHNLIVSQTGIAGSTKTGHHVIMGGQCGVVGHLEIASGTMLATRSGVSKSIDKAGAYGGSPVMPLADYNRWQVLLRNVEMLTKKIKNLESKLKVMENAP
jgi:UDP-3-O-[3-hydroxymyristoyl] glucosamine N-acyltransferase